MAETLEQRAERLGVAPPPYATAEEVAEWWRDFEFISGDQWPPEVLRKMGKR